MDIIKPPDDCEPPKPVVFNRGKVFSFPTKRELGEPSDKTRAFLLYQYVANHEAMFGRDV